jgi:hypothetical protein
MELNRPMSAARFPRHVCFPFRRAWSLENRRNSIRGIMRATITLHYTLVADTVVPLSAIKRRVFAIPSGDKSDGFTNYTTPG